MLAMQCRELGGPEQLVATELPDPVPGEREIAIAVEAAGVNFPDGLIVAGTYQSKPEPPFVPGSEVAGRVAARGAGLAADEFPVGAPVVAFTGMGGYAERITVAATRAHGLPDGIDPVHAAVFPVAYGTSYHGLVDIGHLAAGETLLVLGASGGVGLTAVQIGKALGATVIAAASSAEKLALCAASGADVLINYRDEDLAAAVKDATSGAGVDVVYDPVGGSAADAAVRRLAWHGRYLTVGYAAGTIPSVPMNRLLLKEASLSGVLWGAWATRNPDANAANMAQIVRWYQGGVLRPHIDATYPLTEAPQALAAVLGRRVSGKVVLTTQEYAR